MASEPPTNEGRASDQGNINLLPTPISQDNPDFDLDDARESGPCAGLVEALSLMWAVPGFFRFMMFMGIMAGGIIVPATYVIPPLLQQIWVEKAASNGAWVNCARSLLSVAMAPHFGQWSDKRGRRLPALFLMTIAGFWAALPVFVMGRTENALWVTVVLTALAGPFAVHLTGSPVMWAFAADILPREHRETGFAMLMGVVAMGSFLFQLCAKYAQDAVDPAGEGVYGVITLCAFIIANLLLMSLYNIEATNEDQPGDIVDEEEHVQASCLQKLFSPLNLLWKRASLRALCMVAGLLTLGDIAASDVSSQVLWVMLKVTSTDQWTDIVFFYNCWPMPIIFVIIVGVGIASRRFGPHQFLRCWLPITVVAFGVPALLEVDSLQGHGMILLAGTCAVLPLSNYGPLQVLVVHVVPAKRVGEAMGTMAACKNLASLIAPFIIGSITEYLAANDENGYLWAIFPGCAVVMMCAWPFTFVLGKRVPSESAVTWSSWASTARPSIWRLSNATRPSNLGPRGSGAPRPSGGAPRMSGNSARPSAEGTTG